MLNCWRFESQVVWQINGFLQDYQIIFKSNCKVSVSQLSRFLYVEFIQYLQWAISFPEPK